MDISVVIPVYNSESCIVECVNSVIAELSSTNYLWEIIAVNDGSKDRSYDLLLELKQSSYLGDRITIIDQKNSGVATARNAGIVAAKGEYIALNDSDDRWLKGRIEMLMPYFETIPNCGMVSGKHVDQKSFKEGAEEFELVTVRKQLFKGHFSAPCVIFRKEIIKKVGLFNPDQKYREDGSFFNRICYFYNACCVNRNVAECILNKRVYGDKTGLSSHLKEMEYGELSNIKEAYKKLSVPFYIFIAASVYSYLKYIRRVIISKMR